MFYNTGIATYIWILCNNKPGVRRGRVQLINATDRYSKMRKSLGSKRQYVDDANSDAIVRAYGAFEETGESRIFPVEAFGYRRITAARGRSTGTTWTWPCGRRHRRALSASPMSRRYGSTTPGASTAC
jgi:type I restriction enzyme M protein